MGAALRGIVLPRLTGVLLSVAVLVYGPLATPAGALCAPFSREGSFKRAEVVLIGVAEEGPVTPDGALTSPAAFEVLKYQKGSGPSRVRVETGLSASTRKGFFSVSSVGIGPNVGETWQIFGEVRGEVLRTSTCAGSRQLRATLPDTGLGARWAAGLAIGLLLMGGLVVLWGEREIRRTGAGEQRLTPRAVSDTRSDR